MRRRYKWMLGCGLLLVLAGTVIFAYLLAECGFDAVRFAGTVSDEEVIRRSYEPGDDFGRIEITGMEADVRLLPSEAGSCRVVCDVAEQREYDVFVQGDTLYITTEATKMIRWFSLNLHAQAVTVYLPGDRYESVKIDSVSGDIELKKMEIGRLEIATASGEMELEGLRLGSGKLQSASGDIHIRDMDAENEIRIGTASGDMCMENCDAPSFVLSSASGDIFADLKSGKKFDVDSMSGDVNLPEDLPVNGSFRADTASGDVHVQIAQK